MYFRFGIVTHQTQGVDSGLYYNRRELEATQEGDGLICRQEKILIAFGYHTPLMY